MKFPLDWLLLNKWLWITILGCWAVAVGPVVVLYLLLFLPGPTKVVGVFGLIIGWGVASGYKDWIKTRKREEEKPHEEF